MLAAQINRRGKLFWGGVILFFFVGLFFFFGVIRQPLLEHREMILKNMPRSPFLSLTGYYCPGCGSTRAAFSLLEGNWRGAIGYNPIWILAIPLLIYLVYVQIRVLIAPASVPIKGHTYAPPWLLWGFITILFLYWIARNIPFYPFTLLAP